MPAGAEGQKKAARFERWGLRTLDKDEVLGLLEGAIRHTRRSISQSHVVTGVSPSWIALDGENAKADPTAAF